MCKKGTHESEGSENYVRREEADRTGIFSLAEARLGRGEPVVAVLKYLKSCHRAEIGHIL